MAIKFNAGAFLTGLQGGYGPQQKGGNALSDKSWAMREGIRHSNSLELEKEKAKIGLDTFKEKKYFERLADKKKQEAAYWKQILPAHEERRKKYFDANQSYNGIGINKETFRAALATPNGRNYLRSKGYRYVIDRKKGIIPHPTSKWKFSEDFGETENIAFSTMADDLEAYSTHLSLLARVTPKAILEAMKDPKVHKHGFQFVQDNTTSSGYRLHVPNYVQKKLDRWKGLGLGNDVVATAKNYLIAEDKRIKNNDNKIINSDPVAYAKQQAQPQGFVKKPDEIVTFKPLSNIVTLDGERQTYNSFQKKTQSFIVDTVKQIAKEQKFDLKPHHTAAILAAAHAESSMGIQNRADEGVKGDSLGLFHILIDTHKKSLIFPEGIDAKTYIQDPEGNLRLILTQINKGAFNLPEFKNAKDYKEASRVFTEKIEIPADMSSAIAKRENFAKQFYQALKVTKGKINTEGETIPVARTNKLKNDMGSMAERLTKIEHMRTFFGKKQEIDKDGLIGTKENPASDENLSIIIKAGEERYPTIASSSGSLWEKANKMITKNNRIANKEHNFKVTKLNNDNQKFDYKEHNYARLSIGGKYDYTYQGKTVSIPPIMNDEEMIRLADNYVASSDSNSAGKITKLDSSHYDFMRAVVWNGYFKRLFNSKIPAHKALAKQLASDENYGLKIKGYIDGSAGVTPFLARAFWNLSDKNLDGLSKAGFETELKKAFVQRKQSILNSGIKNGIHWDFEKGKDASGNDVEIAVPRLITKNDDLANTDGSYFSPSVRVPGPNSSRISLDMTFGPRSVNNSAGSFMSTMLTPGTKFTLPENAEQSEENLRRVQIKNENIQQFQNVVRKDLIEKVFSQGSFQDKVTASKLFFQDIEKNPKFNKYRGLLGDDIINGIAWRITLEHMKENTTEGQVFNVKGSKIPVHQLTQSVRLLDEKTARSSEAVKEAEQIINFGKGVQDLGYNLMSNFSDLGVSYIENAMSGMSPLVSEVYNETWNNLKADERTAEGLRTAFQRMSVSAVPEEKEKGEIMLKALEMAGADRASNVGTALDTVNIWLGTAQTAITDFVRGQGTLAENVLGTLTGGFSDKLNQYAENNGFSSGSTSLTINGQKRQKSSAAHQQIKNIDEKRVDLERYRNQASERLKRDLTAANNVADASKRQSLKLTAIKTAQRTFNAIAMTYMFAGMVQGGSGGRAISNEDFENMYNALWGGGGILQATNIKNAMRFVNNAIKRAEIIKSAAKRGTGLVQKITTAISPIQIGLSLYQAAKETALERKILSNTSSAHSAVFRQNMTLRERALAVNQMRISKERLDQPEISNQVIRFTQTNSITSSDAQTKSMSELIPLLKKQIIRIKDGNDIKQTDAYMFILNQVGRAYGDSSFRPNIKTFLANTERTKALQRNTNKSLNSNTEEGKKNIALLENFTLGQLIQASGNRKMGLFTEVGRAYLAELMRNYIARYAIDGDSIDGLEPEF